MHKILSPLTGRLIQVGGKTHKNLVQQGIMTPYGNSEPTRYRVVFKTKWGSDAIPLNYPKDPHTGTMFLITHNDEYRVDDNGYASNGIKRSAEMGESDILMEEAKEQSQNVYQVKTGDVVMTPGQATFIINATNEYHYLTFVTMIAPSSDLFTTTTIDLNQIQQGTTKFPLFAYDAGTDANTNFVLLPKHPRKSPQPIHQITGRPLYQKEVIPFAYLSIDQIQGL